MAAVGAAAAILLLESWWCGVAMRRPSSGKHCRRRVRLRLPRTRWYIALTRPCCRTDEALLLLLLANGLSGTRNTLLNVRPGRT